MTDPFADYRLIPAVNWSTLKHLARSPLHYKYAVENPRPDTPALRRGRLVHCAVLEPDELLSRYIVWSGRRAGRLYENTIEANPNHEVVTEGEYDTALAIRDAVRANPDAARLLEGAPEQTVTWTDKATGLDCKARLDLVGDGLAYVADLKTTTDIEAGAFGRTCAKYAYHSQLAFYADGLATLLGIGQPEVFIIAVESDPPHDVAVFEVGEDELWAGHDAASELLAKLKECRETDSWPGRYEGPQPLRLPAWAYPEDEDEMRLMGLVSNVKRGE